MERGRAGLLGISLAMTMAVPALADPPACPDLSGVFECPAADKQPAMSLVITSKESVAGGRAYTITYRIMGKDLPSEAEGIPRENASRFPSDSICDGGALFLKSAGETGEGARLSINSAGNFERSKAGKIELTCTRKAN